MRSSLAYVVVGLAGLTLFACGSEDGEGEPAGTGVGGGRGTNEVVARGDAAIPESDKSPDKFPATNDAGTGSNDAGGGSTDGSTTTPGDSSSPQNPGTLPAAPAPPQEGAITFRMDDKHWHRIQAKVGATAEDLDVGLDKISNGTDEFVSPSADGQWLLVQSSRFGCSSGSCLSRFYWDLSAGEAILTGGNKVSTAEGRAVISSGGGTIVYPGKNGPHAIDLFVTRIQANGTWTSPAVITGASPFSHHHDAAISADGSKVVFDCGNDPYGAPPTSICEVKTDGTGFRTAVSPSDGPDNGNSHSAHHGDYAPDGTIVFEADWPSEQVWRMPASGTPELVSPSTQTNDNSPCVLADGSIASLWLGRSGGGGNHEIKVMSPSGTTFRMQLTGIDVVDIGMGCGN